MLGPMGRIKRDKRNRFAASWLVAAGLGLCGCPEDGDAGPGPGGSTNATTTATATTTASDTTGGGEASTSSSKGSSGGAEESCINIQAQSEAPCFGERLKFVPSLKVAYGDFSGDGQVDVAAVTNPDGDASDGVQLIEGMGTDFGDAAQMAFAEALMNDGNPASLGALRVLGGAEADRLFVQGTYGSLGSITVDLWWSRTDGTFERFLQPTASPPTGPWIGDFDGDGDQDLAFAPNAGDLSVIDIYPCQAGDCGPAQRVAAPDAPAGPWTVLPGDVDGDGTDELVAVTRTDEGAGLISIAYVLTRSGSDFSTAAPVELGAGLSAFRLELADLTDDGVVDLLAVADHGDPSADDNANELLTFPGNGAGGFGAPEGHVFQANLTGYSIGDLDGDGVSELFARIGDKPGIEVWRGIGDASFEPWFGLMTSAEPTGASGAAVPIWPTRALDFDGDGDLDLLTVIGQGGTNTFAVALLYQK